MPTLYVLRHAAAEVASPDGSDHSRKLSDVGVQQVTRAAVALQEMSPAPERILASTSKRARQTADLMGLGLPTTWRDELYLASWSAVADEIAQTPSEVASLL